MDEERESEMFDIFFADCNGTLQIYHTALELMLAAYSEVKSIAEMVCNGEVLPEQAPNVLFKLAFFRNTFLKAREELTSEACRSNVFDISQGIINTFKRDAGGRENARKTVDQFNGKSGFNEYETARAMLYWSEQQN